MYSHVAVHRYGEKVMNLQIYAKTNISPFLSLPYRSIIMADNQQQNGSDTVDKAAVEVAQMALESKPEPAAKEPASPAASGSESAAKKETNGTTPKPAAPVSAAAFREQFKAFSKFGDTKSDGKHLTLSQSDKWMKQAKVNVLLEDGTTFKDLLTWVILTRH